jgi:hypothetical protein
MLAPKRVFEAHPTGFCCEVVPVERALSSRSSETRDGAHIPPELSHEEGRIKPGLATGTN